MRLLSILTALAASAAVAVTAPAAALERVQAVHGVLQLSTSYAPESSLPAYLGYWEEEGLDVEVATLAGATVGTQLVISGSADVLIGSPHTSIGAVQRGADLKIYYTARRGDIFGVGLPTEHGLTSVEDLRGKTIGVSNFASNTTTYLKSLLGNAGISEDEVTIVEVGVGGRAAAAIRSGQVQAISLFDEAFVQLEQSGIEITTILRDPDAESSFTGSIIARGEDLTERRDILIGIARGIAKAHAFAEANPQAAMRIHWEVYPQTAPGEGVTDEAVALAADRFMANSHVHARDAFGTDQYGELPEEVVREFVEYLVANGQVEEVGNVEDYFTNELIDEINDFDIEAIREDAKNFTMP